MNKDIELFHIKGVRHSYFNKNGVILENFDDVRKFDYLAIKMVNKNKTNLKVLYSFHDGIIHDIRDNNIKLDDKTYGKKVYSIDEITKKPIDVSTKDFVDSIVESNVKHRTK